MERTAGLRAARAALIAAALIVLSLAGHTAGHGTLDLLGVAIVAVLAVGFGTALGARRLTPASVITVLLAGQLLLHIVLTFTSAHHAAASSTSTPLMVLGHVLAAAIAAALVLHADGLVRAWMRLLAAVIGGLSIDTPLPAPLALVHATSDVSVPRVGSLQHAVVRRGPPVSPALT